MVGEAIVKRGDVRAVESGSTASKYKEYGANRVHDSGQAMAVAQHGRARRRTTCFHAGHTYCTDMTVEDQARRVVGQ